MTRLTHNDLVSCKASSTTPTLSQMAIPWHRVNRWASSLGAMYAFVAVVYFFLNFARNLGKPVAELLPSIAMSLIVAVSPYLILLVATLLAVDRRVNVAIAIVIGLSLLAAIPLYAGAFHPAQDGEFMFAFVLVSLPTIGLAAILAVAAVLLRGVGTLPSNE